MFTKEIFFFFEVEFLSDQIFIKRFFIEFDENIVLFFILQ